MTAKNNEKTYRTLTEIMAAPAGESLETIARVAAPIERIISGTGALKLLFNETVATAQDPKALAKMTDEERAEINNKMIEIGAEVVALLLRSLADYMPECKEVLAAVNGVTVAELEESYTGFEIVRMVKALVSDEGFLSSVRTFAG